MEERKGIKWDEEGIKEHDQTRGTRMKITEPKTPYNYYNEDEDEELAEVNMEEALPKLEKLKKKQEFEEKRKNHYNEFEMMKKFKMHENSEDEDENIIVARGDLQNDLSKASYLNDVLTSLMRSTQDNHLPQIMEQLKILEQEIERAEKSLSVLENTVENLAHGHATFNESEAAKVQSLVNSLEDFIEKLDQKIRSVDFSTVKNTIPKAIVGQATGDFQAFHSVDKIKQESLKLESTIAGNSKFFWIWTIISALIILTVYIITLINKAAKSNL